MKKLAGKVAVVTGGANGIGQACCERLLKDGAKVVVVDLDAKKGRELVESIKSRGHEAQYISCDVSSSEQVDRMVRTTVEVFGRIDILVNNAGIIHSSDFLDLSEEDFDRVLNTNLKGPLLCSQAVARRMVAQGNGGAIINMSSVNSVMAIPNQVPYTVSKGGLNQLTRVMAIALAEKGIRVNAVAPGSVMTELLKTVMNDDAARRKILSRTPLGRCAEPEEIASVVSFLASDDSSYLTGEIIYADGGRIALNYTMPVTAPAPVALSVTPRTKVKRERTFRKAA